MMTNRVLLIDGHSLAYRAYFALPVENFSTSTGQHTNAIYGFASMLMNLIRDEKPTHIAAAFDVSRKTFRSEKFPEYKANRAATPDEFRSQITYINELVDAFQIPRFEVSGFEADDVIATIVAEIGEDSEILICTGDRDSFQLISDRVTVLYPKKGVTELARMTPEAVEEKYGLRPEQYPDFAALRGDPSDNLPSIPGVGEKTAAKWINEYNSLANLVARVDEVPGKVGAALRDALPMVIQNRELTELRRDVPIEVSIGALKWPGIDVDRSIALFEKLEIKALRDRARALSGKVDSKPKETKSQVKVLPNIAALKNTSDAIGILQLEDGFAVATGDSEVVVISEVTSDLVERGLVTHDAKRLIRDGKLPRVSFDTQLAAYLLNPGTRDLEFGEVVERYLGVSIAPVESDLFGSAIDPKLAAYLIPLKDCLEKELADLQLLELFNNLELPTLHRLAEMERIGIAVNHEALTNLHNHFAEIENAATSSAYKAAGREFNVASPKQLQAILFEELDLPKTKKIKTGYSTDAESLEWLFAKTKHPLLENLLKIREVSKLRTTVAGLQSAIGKDGRIHTTFQQTVTATGRLSSTDPNLQNIPIRTDEGRKIRATFIAGKGYAELMTADYSQIEMRIMAHLSKDDGLKVGDVDSEMRRQIKAMSYGLAYGLSSFGLAQQLDISPADASALMGKYFERFGGIQDYLKEVVRVARDKGYTETILGRRRYLPDLSHENRQRREVAERMALNAPIQGSAADIIKVAMLNVESAMAKAQMNSRLLLQVHDELIFEVAEGERDAMEQLVRREMGSAYPLRAPLDVSVGFGPNWDQAGH
jgi:DNA polymerase-1